MGATGHTSYASGLPGIRAAGRGRWARDADGSGPHRARRARGGHPVGPVRRGWRHRDDPGTDRARRLSPIVAVATPLPVILPTAAVGAFTYHRAGEVDMRAAAWISLTGAAASAVGALLTEAVNARLLLVVTAALLGWQSIQILRGRSRPAEVEERPIHAWTLAFVGVVAGLLSGLLGIGGGLVIVPALAGMLGAPAEASAGNVARRRRRPRHPGHDRARGARQHRLGRGAVLGDRFGAGGALGSDDRPRHQGAHAPPDGRELPGVDRGRSTAPSRSWRLTR